MGPEQDTPQTTSPEGILPIDQSDSSDTPPEMVVPGGDPNAGAIDVIETTPGVNKQTPDQEDWEDPGTPHPVADGLPVVGAATEELKREIDGGVYTPENTRLYAERTGTTLDEAADIAAKLEDSPETPDEAGEVAMVAMLRERVKTSEVYEHASDKLKEEMLKEVEASFRKDQEKKLAERQKQFDASAQEVIDRLKNGEPLEKVIPETVELDGGDNTTTTSDQVPDHIDATPDLSPESEETGDWKPEHLEGSDKPV